MRSVQSNVQGGAFVVQKPVDGESLEGAFVETAFSNEQVASAINEEALRKELDGECAFLVGGNSQQLGLRM